MASPTHFYQFPLLSKGKTMNEANFQETISHIRFELVIHMALSVKQTTNLHNRLLATAAVFAEKQELQAGTNITIGGVFTLGETTLQINGEADITGKIENF